MLAGRLELRKERGFPWLSGWAAPPLSPPHPPTEAVRLAPGFLLQGSLSQEPLGGFNPLDTQPPCSVHKQACQTPARAARPQPGLPDPSQGCHTPARAATPQLGPPPCLGSGRQSQLPTTPSLLRASSTHIRSLTMASGLPVSGPGRNTQLEATPGPPAFVFSGAVEWM